MRYFPLTCLTHITVPSFNRWTGFRFLHDFINGQIFARKIIHAHNAHQNRAASNELRAMGKLCAGGHKNIIEIYGHGVLRNSTYHFIDMDLCDFDLKEYLRSRGDPDQLRVPRDRLPAESQTVQLWDIMRQIAEAIAFIHSHGLVHRDLKPRNGIQIPIFQKILTI
jgi:serine/threonine protein kinase